LHKGIKLRDEKNDLLTNYELTTLNNIALVYRRDGRLDQALDFFLKAYANAIHLGHYKKAAEYGINLGTLLCRRYMQLSSLL